MSKISEKADQPPDGSLDALRAELGELRRRVVVSDGEIDALQVQAASKRRWYRDPSVLVATLALVVSISTFAVGQVNIISDRRIQDRTHLSSLLAQLPAAETAQYQNPVSVSNDLLLLIASTAATLIEKLGPEESTASEKSEVAYALNLAGDLPTAKQLAAVADQQATNVREKDAAERIIANIDFETGDFVGGRDTYRRIVRLLLSPQTKIDSPALRTVWAVSTEAAWVNDEISFSNTCQNATEQLNNATRALDQLQPQDLVGIAGLRKYLDAATNRVIAKCPTAKR